MNEPDSLEDGRQLMTAETGMVTLLNKSEIDMQIATAHKYPRSLTQFRRDVHDMVTISEQVAQECIYALPRDGKVIEGPSARFAEIVASAWGNSRAGARVVSDAGDFVTSQGVFHDLQKNVAITYEVQRRITNKNGRRFSADMIGVTANAACSIALRNAILKGVPKAFWAEMYDAARRTVMGDVKTLPNRRAEAFKAFQGYGVTVAQILAKLGLRGEADIGLEQLLVLRGLLTAIKDGDTTPEVAFSMDDSGGSTVGGRDKWLADVAACETLEALATLASGKGAAVADFQRTKDTEGYSQFVKAVQARGVAIRAKAPTTAEAVAATAAAMNPDAGLPETGAPDPEFVAAMDAAEKGATGA